MGMIGLSFYILADTLFVSKVLGANGLAALNLAIPIYNFIDGTGLMYGMGGSTKYSIYKGQRDNENSDKIFTNTIYSAVVTSVIFMLIGIFFSQKLTLLLGADTAIYDMTNIYLKVILLFAPAFMINHVFICFVRNDGNPRLSMLAMLGGSISNVILDYIFLFPFHMGIFGAALATGFSPLISILILSRHWLKKQNTFHLKITIPAPSIIASIISLGIPSLITEISSGIVIIVFNTIILSLNGNIGVAAYGVIANFSLVVICVFTGIAQGIQPIISRAYGENNTKSIKHTLRYGIAAMLVISAVVYSAIFVFADLITGVFNSKGNADLQTIATSGMKLYFIAAPFVGFNMVISSFFTSIEKAAPAYLISLLRGFVFIVPMVYLLSAFAELTGVWLAFPVTEGIVCVLGIILYYKPLPTDILSSLRLQANK